MEFQLPQFSLALPVMMVLGFALFALLADLFAGKACKNIAYGIVQLGLLTTAAVVVYQGYGESNITFNGHFIADKLSYTLQFFILCSAFIAFVYSREYVNANNMPRAEYYILGLFAVMGMMVMVSANSMLTIYLGLELLSLPLYAMVALKRDDANATEAAMKYFVMGAMASGIMLYGMSIVYGATGYLDIASIQSAVKDVALTDSQWSLLAFGFIFILVGLAFKFAAAPFHMWAPDVYAGAPASVVLFLGSVPKLAALGMTLRFIMNMLPQLHGFWGHLVIVLSVLSMGLGNLLAIAQTNIRRMLAYSAIAHIGYLFLGLVSGTAEGYNAAIFYTVVYVMMSLAALGMIVLLSRAGVDLTEIDDLKGLNTRSPWLAMLMMLIMLSMAGVPPMLGFFAKLLVIKSLVAVGLYPLAIAAMLFAIVGAFYYIRVVKVMYFEESQDAQLAPIQLSRDAMLVLSLNALMLLVLGLFPGALLQFLA